MNIKTTDISKKLGVSLFIIVLLVIDQTIKFEVKTNMPLGGSIHITDWFYIRFIENNGMAYGMTFINKPILSIFRLALSSLLLWYIFYEIGRKARMVYVIVLSVVFAGAIGNLIDCMFYGEIFSVSSPYFTSYLVPFGEGYSSFLQGKVVDMFYFPIIETTWPDWVPIWGGSDFTFFNAIFNFADACISVGFVLLLVFCRKDLSGLSFFNDDKSEKVSAETESAERH